MSASKKTFMADDSDYLSSIIVEAIQMGPPEKDRMSTIELLRKHAPGIQRMLNDGWTATQVAELFTLKLGVDVRPIHIGKATKSKPKSSSKRS